MSFCGLESVTSQRLAAPCVLCPKLPSMADISTDFPAPEGPVKTTKPLSNSNSTSSKVTSPRR